MNIQEIELLIQKYLEGDCTVKEKQWLQHYFAKADIPEALKKYQIYFEEEGNDRQNAVVPSVIENDEKEVSKKPAWLSDLWIVVAAAVVGSLLFLMNIVQQFTEPEKGNVIQDKVVNEKEELSNESKDSLKVIPKKPITNN